MLTKSSNDLINKSKQMWKETSNKKKEKKKRKPTIDGLDDGEGPTKLVQTYVNHVFGFEQSEKQNHVRLEYFSDAFKEGTFDSQLNSLEIRSVPYNSTIAVQRNLGPKNSTQQKKFFIDFTDRLKDDDGFLIRARMGNCGIDDFVVEYICKGLVRNTHLESLMLHNNAITDIGVEYLCHALRWHPVFHTLWLGANKISDIGARHLSLLIKRNQNIKELNISNKWPNKVWAQQEYDLHPHITYIGADYLATQLKKGAGLTSLSLVDQRIRDDGAIMLFNVLTVCQLRSLNLSANELSDRCCEQLKLVLPQNPIIEELIMSKNEITDEGAMAIAYGISLNNLLCIVDLSYNQIEAKGLYALFKCLDYNSTVHSLITVGNKDEDDRAENAASTRNRSVFFFNAKGRSNSFSENENQKYAIEVKPVPSRKELRKSLTQSHFIRESSLLFPIEESGNKEQDTAEENEEIEDDDNDDQFEGNSDTLSKKSSIFENSVMMKPHRRASSFAELNITPFKTNLSTRSSGMMAPGVEVHGKKRITKMSFQNNSYLSPSKSINNSIKEGSDFSNSIVAHLKSPEGSPSPPRSSKRNRILDAIAVAVNTVNALEEKERKDIQIANDDDDDQANNDDELNDINNDEIQVVKEKKTVQFTSSPIHSSTNSKSSGSESRTNESQATIPSASSNLSTESSTSIKQSIQDKLISRKEKHEKEKFLEQLQNNTLETFLKEKSAIQSENLGRTLGIPKLANAGIKPIRTTVTPYGDSAQHLMYLRVATSDDPENTRPYSLVRIGLDRIEEREKVMKERQKPRYKYVSIICCCFLFFV